MAKRVKGLCVAAFWLLLWQLAAALVNNKVLLVGPVETAAALLELLPTPQFLRAVLGSAVNIALGFLTGFAVGVLSAAASYRLRLVGELLLPLINAVKSVPVVSFVILALIWFGSGRLSFFVTLTVVAPIIYLNTLEGLRSADVKLIELARVYRMGIISRARGVYFPSVYPQLLSGTELACGMAFKSGVAAEVIGQSAGSLGNELYRAKIYLETDKVLAVSLTAVALAWALGRLAVWALRRLGGAYED